MGSRTSYIVVSMKRLTVLGLCLAVAGTVVVLAQDDNTIRLDVNLVSILASVRSKSGALISNLTKDDFKIYEDGKEQQIRNFARETDLPLTLGLLVDTSSSQERLSTPNSARHRSSSAKFFAKRIRRS